ncbi:MAG: winged helix-turn-helix domain-containing protein [Candidatus Diapherotrites archaeon]|nr:winged helix-turn-helix domain-containing protein [Candidatus Diapherotrites archaeon]
MKKAVAIGILLLKMREITQKRIAEMLKVSLSTVNNTVKTLESMGAIEVTKRGVRVIDAEKILMYVANKRNLYKDVIYKTRVNMPVAEIEKSMPAGVEFTGYTAYKFKYRDVPADYSEVYVYADEESLEEIKRRFPERRGPSNLFVLRKEFEVTDPLIFADLWNMREWYAKEFVRRLRDRILE